MRTISAIKDLINLIMWIVGAIRGAVFKSKIDEAGKKAESTKDTSDIERLINK